MKKLLLALVLVLGFGVAVPVSAVSPVSAASNFVEGEIVINGNAAKGAKVIVTCDTGYAKTTTASSAGFYSVVFKKDRCPVGHSVTVTAKKGNKGGSTTKTITGETTTANVNVATTVAVPEFNPIIGLTTAVAVGGGLVVMRRRQLGQN